MERSDSRILTTHAGSLPRPDDLLALNAEVFRLKPEATESQSGSGLKPEVTASGGVACRQRLRNAVHDVVTRQTQLGIDIVNDGEFGKAMRTRLDYGAWISYVIERFTGFEGKATDIRSPSPAADVSAVASAKADVLKPGSFQKRRDRQAFPEVYAEIDREMFGGGPRPMGRPIIGKVTYRGHDALQADIENLRVALGRDRSAFMTSPAPGTFGRDQNRYYKTQEEFLFAVADALGVEYRAITDAGFILQIDDPGMAENWDAMDPSVTLEEYRAYARLCIDALNHALAGIPEERVRYHMCWGSWHGPHLTDIPLRDIVDLLLTIRTGPIRSKRGTYATSTSGRCGATSSCLPARS